MNPYTKCPTVSTKSFTIRLVAPEDSAALFRCYNDKKAVELMNDDNCDFGFFVDSVEQMSKTIGYWLDFYKQQYFIRFSVVDSATNEAVGTIEGFCGETGVLRIDLASAYEKEAYISEIIGFAKERFREYFGNERLVTKAIKEAAERRKALTGDGWEYIGDFRNFPDYYMLKL